MTDSPNYGFDTLQIHAGAKPDPATGARQTPIYQTTAYVFRDADHAAALFNLQEVGFIYSRLTNPTVAVLQAAVDKGDAKSLDDSQPPPRTPSKAWPPI